MSAVYDLSDFGKGGLTFRVIGIISLVLGISVGIASVPLDLPLVLSGGLLGALVGMIAFIRGSELRKDKIVVLFHTDPFKTQSFELLFNTQQEAEYVISTLQIPNPQVRAVAEKEQLLVKQFYPQNRTRWEAAAALNRMKLEELRRKYEH